MDCAKKEANCQRLWSKIETTLVLANQVTPPTVEAYAEPAKQENMKIMKRRKKKRWRWGWWRPAKTLRRVQLNSPNGLAYHLFTHMLSVQCCGLPHVTDFRILKIVSSPSSGVLNNHKGEILPFCSETKIEISVCDNFQKRVTCVAFWIKFAKTN